MKYDFCTSNISFIEMHRFLKMVGVRNNKFMISRFEPNNNTTECLENVWYFLRHIIKVHSANALHDFELNVASMATIYLLNSGCNVYELAPRQYGHKSSAIAAYMLWRGGTIFLHNKDSKDKILSIQANSELLLSSLRSIYGCNINPFPNEKEFHWYDDAEHDSNVTDGIDKLIRKRNKQFTITTTVGKEDNDDLKYIRSKCKPFSYSMYDLPKEKLPKWVIVDFDADRLGMSESDKNRYIKLFNWDKKAFDRELMLIRD